MCCKHITPLAEPDPNSIVGSVQWRAECDTEVIYGVLAPLPLADDYQVQNNCQHNQLLSAINRVAKSWLPVDLQDMLPLHAVGRSIAKYIGHRDKVNFDVWGKHYTGYKKVRYTRAVASLIDRPLNKKDGYIQAFVKLEKLTDPSKDPRMIQARSARFNVELGCFLKGFEHKLYHMAGTGPMKRWLPPGRCIVKGMNPAARGALMEQHWYSLKKPVQVNLDCSRFDAHCSVPLLRVEHAVYKRIYRNDSKLNRLLDMQLRNTCFTKCGLRYEVDGRRMSGDMNTALGNCVLMVIMLTRALKDLGFKPSEFRLADDGDDCCLMVEEDRLQDALRLPGIFRSYGHKLKIESVAHRIEHVTLCDARPIRVGGRRVMITRPGRVIGKSRVHTRLRSTKVIRDYVATTGQCYLAQHSGVPVLQEHACALRRVGELFHTLPGTFMYKLRMPDVLEATAVPIDLETRLDFAQAFGVSVDTQFELESWYRKVTTSQLIGEAPAKEVPGWNYVSAE